MRLKKRKNKMNLKTLKFEYKMICKKKYKKLKIII